MSDLKLRYEELLIDRGWDKDTQIQHFLEYAAEFKLEDHFFSLSGTKADGSDAYSGFIKRIFGRTAY